MNERRKKPTNGKDKTDKCASESMNTEEGLVDVLEELIDVVAAGSC